MSAGIAQAEVLRLELALEDLRESPINHRRTWGNLEELASSIKKVGILQPLLARSVPGGPGGEHAEIVFGHRRYRAAKMAGLKTVPVTLRKMTDEEVLEAQVIENLQRQDVHPLEEAEGYEQLEGLGYGAEDIAAKIGKSKAYVYGRLKLLALCPEARKAFYADELTASTALYVARIPSPKLQLEAIKTIGGNGKFDEDPLSAREAAKEIQQRFMLRLVEAPFDITAAELVPKAGSCSACPKRTGNQPELFPDVESADVCTDTECYRSKLDAEWAKRTAAAKAAGTPVLSAKEAKETIFKYGTHAISSGGGFVALDAKCYADPKQRTHRELLKKAMPPMTLARNPETGAILELVQDKTAKAAMKRIGHKFAQPGEREPKPARDPKDKAAAEKLRLERAVEKKVGELAVAAIVKAAEKRQPTPAFWTALTLSLQSDAYRDVYRVYRRRGLLTEEQEATGVDELELLAELTKKLTEAQLRGLVVELAIGDEAETVNPESSFKSWCELFKVDPKSFKAEAKKLAKAELDAPPAKKGVASRARVASPEEDGERACRVCGCTEDHACVGGCDWAEEDLCTACEAQTSPKPPKPKKKARRA